MKKTMYERIKALEAAVATLTEEYCRDLDDALWLIEDLRDRQRGARRA